MRDLSAFIYLIFVFITAYGVVSRALMIFGSLELTAKSLLTSIFYRPYWLLYSIVDEEMKDFNRKSLKIYVLYIYILFYRGDLVKYKYIR